MLLAHDDLALRPATVATAIERIVAACQPQAIIAFGSRVRGEARPDSDLDLFVLLHAPAADAGVLRRRLRALLADLPLSKDILVSEPGNLRPCSHTAQQRVPEHRRARFAVVARRPSGPCRRRSGLPRDLRSSPDYGLG